MLADHMLCAIDRFVDLSICGGISHRSTARWADLLDPELMIRMLLDDMAGQDWGNA